MIIQHVVVSSRRCFICYFVHVALLLQRYHGRSICRWDGLPGPDVILEQTYYKKHWEAHWKWLIKFLKHDKYIKVDGKAMLIVYRAHDVPGFSKMIEYWQQLAKGAGAYPHYARQQGH